MAKRIYNQTSLFGPLYAYPVVLSPPREVKDYIAKIKKDLNAIADIGERNVQSIAHITLFDKLTDDENLKETTEQLIARIHPFTIRTGKWNYYDHGHSVTVILEIENPAPIIEIMGTLKSKNKSPHISLAKRISHNTFEKLKPYLESLNYTAQWHCTEINVLRKLMSEKHLGFKESFTIPLK
jgi:2'-5' RNA ligase